VTLLELVNRVLRRLRESTVTALDTEYSLLIADFVADAHREVQEYHDWSGLDRDVDVQILNGVVDYDLTAIVADGGSVVGTAADIPGENSFLRFYNETPQIWLYDDDTDTTGSAVALASWEALDYHYRSDTEITNVPYMVALQPAVGAPGWRMRVWPKPNEDYLMRLRFHVPEALIDPYSDAAEREIATPHTPIVLGALFYALNERGEEMGEPGQLAERRFYATLASMKERDVNLPSRTDNNEFYRA
jgi:hypothetical protein